MCWPRLCSLAGRPAEQVERALLSRVDFTAGDVPAMLFSAAYLTRFGANESALRLYRQASRLSPHRPEPYVLGFKLARQTKQADAVAWACAGILEHGWVDDFERLHREAENVSADTIRSLESDGLRDDAAKLRRQIQQARQRDLFVTLAWSGPGRRGSAGGGAVRNRVVRTASRKRPAAEFWSATEPGQRRKTVAKFTCVRWVCRAIIESECDTFTAASWAGERD